MIPTRMIGILTLIVAIGLSPRIPLDIAIPGRRFDLRFEDVILIGLLLFWILNLSLRPRIYLTPLFKSIIIYMLIVLLTTGIAIITINLSPTRSLLYILKEMEYFALYLVVANWTRSSRDIKLASIGILSMGLLNSLWVGWQLITSRNHPLVLVERELSADIYQNPTLLESYGPALIGEASPLSTGGLFLLMSLLTFSLLISSNVGKRRSALVVLGVMFSTSLAMSFSRAAMLAALIGGAILLNQSKLKTAIKIVPIILIVLALTVLMMNHLGFLRSGRLTFEGINNSWVSRWQEIWQPLLNKGFDRIAVGFGKGALGAVGGLQAVEAHNHYLRVLIESGLFGLAAYGWLFANIILLSMKVFKKSKMLIGKGIAGAALSSTVGLIFAALFQDVFTPVILNELWWILVGLTAAVYRIEWSIDQLSIANKDSLPACQEVAGAGERAPL